jgi:competence protein ComEA
MSNIQEKIVLTTSALLVLALLAGCIILAVRLLGNRPQEIQIREASIPEYTCSVNIHGAVASPGTYPARLDESMLSLVNSAGLLDKSDTKCISIYVPGNQQKEESQKVNVNRAETWLLEALPEIGSVKAQAIVDYREKNGPFVTFDDLLKVDGFSEALLTRIINLITLED